MSHINVRTKYINLVEDNGLLSHTELDDFLTWLHNNENVKKYYYEYFTDNNGNDYDEVNGIYLEEDGEVTLY